MGPDRNERQEPKLQAAQRVQALVTVTAKRYFENPLHYLFYGMLTATVVGLFCGLQLDLPYYGILVILAGIKIWNHFHGERK